MMKVKLISLLILFIAFVPACKKDDVVMPDMVKVPTIKGLKESGKTQYEYIYNSSRLESEEKSMYSYTTYNYNAQKQLVTTDYYFNEALLSSKKSPPESPLNQAGLMNFVSSVFGSTIKYEYNTSGQLVKSVVVRSVEGASEYSEYKYDDKNMIIRELLYWDNKVLGYIDYSYDDRRNLIREALYSISSTGLAELNTTTQYEFDNKQNPFRAVQKLLSPGINTNQNNVIKEIYTIHHSQKDIADIIQVTSISYVYSSQGYPVRRSGTIEYIYE